MLPEHLRDWHGAPGYGVGARSVAEGGDASVTKG